METPRARLVDSYGNQTLTGYYADKKAWVAKLAILHNKICAVLDQLGEPTREKLERHTMLLEDEWELKTAFAAEFEERNPTPKRVVVSMLRYERGMNTIKALQAEIESLKEPEYPFAYLRALSQPAPMASRTRPASASPIVLAQPRVLFTDDGDISFPPGKLQRVGDAAVVPMSEDQVNGLTALQRITLVRAMAVKEEEDYPSVHAVYDSDGLATGEEPCNDSSSDTVSSEEEEEQE